MQGRRFAKGLTVAVVGVALGGAIVFSWVRGASAQSTDTPTASLTPTPSVTPTITPGGGLFLSTPTPYALDDTDLRCLLNDEGGHVYPSGWGTVTPSGRWEWLCGECQAWLTATPFAGTYTALPTGGATVTATATAIPGTPTATGTPRTWSLGGNMSGAVFYIPTHQGWSTQVGSVSGKVPWLPVVGYSFDVTDRLNGTGKRMTYTGGGYGESAWNNTSQNLGVTTYCVVDNSSNAPYHVGLTGAEICATVEPGATQVDGANEKAALTPVAFEWALDSYENEARMTVDDLRFIYLGDWQTPTPSATPETVEHYGDSFCSVVEPGPEAVEMGWSGIEYSEVAACVDIGPYDLEILGIGLDVPWLAHLCMRELSFGTVGLFGVALSLDKSLYAMGIVYVIRMIRRAGG